jgi:hypothetical protein
MRADMKKEVNLRTWSGFVRQLKGLKKENKKLFFRGHADARWSLQTTLERRGREDMLIADYYRAAGRVLPQVQTVTGREFELPIYPDALKLLEGYDKFSVALTFGQVPGYAFFIYLRHHGFPAPLLDWTRSPYIAAYFAFASESKGAKKRSIYVWSEGRFRSGGTDQPEMKMMGPYIAAHPRHALQQSNYSLCATYASKKNEWRFTSHEEAMTDDDEGQLWKFNLPSGERAKVLAHLSEYNLNAHSLFGSEESLMETLADREIDRYEE